MFAVAHARDLAYTRRVSLGKRILAARRRKRLTQQQLAERLGVSQNTIACWEGNKTRPRGKRVRALAAELGIKTADIVAGLIDEAA